MTTSVMLMFLFGMLSLVPFAFALVMPNSRWLWFYTVLVAGGIILAAYAVVITNVFWFTMYGFGGGATALAGLAIGVITRATLLAVPTMPNPVSLILTLIAAGASLLLAFPAFMAGVGLFALIISAMR